jgi:hypothetical protein
LGIGLVKLISKNTQRYKNSIELGLKKQINTNMMNALRTLEIAPETGKKKKFYLTELLMLKSIIVLLVLTFFLLNEMQAANTNIQKIEKKLQTVKSETTQVVE